MFLPLEKSPHYYASHYQDVYTDLGYDYRGHILEKTISKDILKNSKVKAILSYVDDMICMLIDDVKQIKLQYMISLDKNDRNVN